MQHTRRVLFTILALIASCALNPLTAPTSESDPCPERGGDWPLSGGDACNRRSAAHETKISAKTAPKLGVKWVYEAAGDVSATPAVVAGSVYVPDWGGKLSRLDAATGKPIWSRAVGDLAGFVDDAGKPLSGLLSRTTPLVAGKNVIIGTQRGSPAIVLDHRPNAFAIAVDKDTAELRWKTPLHGGHPAAVITGSPVLDGDRLYMPVSSLEEAFAGVVRDYQCTFRGSVVALDTRDGKILWQTYTISDERYFTTDASGHKVPSGYAGAAVWSSTPVVDHRRRQLYITTGNNYAVPPGVKAMEAGNGANSVMALDLDTGAVKWSRAFVGAPDVWTAQDQEGPDYDFGAGANLFTVDGRDVVGAGQKSGIYYALNPDTGEILWKTQVGPGGHLGGIHWGTAVDGERIYVGNNNEKQVEYTLGGAGAHAGEKVKVGSWAALDPRTGGILWQTANPQGGLGENGTDVNGPVTVANGVLFAGSMDPQGTMFAIDAATGEVLWRFASGGTVYGGPAIVDGVVYWGSGYLKGRLGFGTTSKKLVAFEVKG